MGNYWHLVGSSQMSRKTSYPEKAQAFPLRIIYFDPSAVLRLSDPGLDGGGIKAEGVQ